MLPAVKAVQQSRTITGKVIDDLNDELIGVNVQIKGTSTGPLLL